MQETLGFDPNFDETLGKQIERARDSDTKLNLPRDLNQSRFDAVIEKCENGLKSMHRPIAFSATADRASVDWRIGGKTGQFDSYFDMKTYQYISKTVTKEDLEEYSGYVSSYNSNTYNGRLYLPVENRTVGFKLANNAISVDSIRLLTSSLRSNAIARRSSASVGSGDVVLRGFRNESINGRLKSIHVVDVYENDAVLE